MSPSPAEPSHGPLHTSATGIIIGVPASVLAKSDLEDVKGKACSPSPAVSSRFPSKSGTPSALSSIHTQSSVELIPSGFSVISDSSSQSQASAQHLQIPISSPHIGRKTIIFETPTAAPAAKPRQHLHHVHFAGSASPDFGHSSSMIGTALGSPADVVTPQHDSLDFSHFDDDALTMGNSIPSCTARTARGRMPRIRSRRFRQSKQQLPAALLGPLLSSPTAAGGTNAAASYGDQWQSHVNSHDTAAAGSFPTKQLRSGLSTVWQQLCKAGRSLMVTGKKLCRKLQQLLGVHEEEAHRLLTEHQAEGLSALPAQPQGQRSGQGRAGQFQGPQPKSRLSHWRL